MSTHAVILGVLIVWGLTAAVIVLSLAMTAARFNRADDRDDASGERSATYRASLQPEDGPKAEARAAASPVRGGSAEAGSG